MSCSAEQLSGLLNFLDDHKDLARGQLRSAEGREKARKLWQEVTHNLNSLGGSHKTVRQWQKVWTDRKHLAKKNAAGKRQSATATGGGEGSNPPTSWELRVLSIVGEGFGAPETIACEPFPTINSGDEVHSYEVHYAEELASPLSEPQLVELRGSNESAKPHMEQQVVEKSDSSLSTPYVEQQAGPSPSLQQSDDSNSQHSAPRNPLRARILSRRRRRVTGETSFGDRLLSYKEEKLSIMRGIQGGLQGLTSVMRELVEIKKKEYNLFLDLHNLF